MEPPRSRMALEAKFVREVPRGMAHQRRRHFPILWPGSVCECDPRTIPRAAVPVMLSDHILAPSWTV